MADDDIKITISAVDNASGNLKKVSTSLDGLGNAGNKSISPLDKLKSGLQGLIGASLGSIGVLGILVTGLTKLVEFLKQSEKAAVASNVELAKSEAILKATGYAANTTSAELQKMAKELSVLTGVDDETITSAQSMLLTFRNIGREALPRATTAALDLSTTFGGLDGASKQLGKALNDPIKGMTALSRSGVQFTEEQKKMIEGFMAVNDIASAQNIILTEVEKQVGGTAEAMEKATDGAAKAQNAYENMQEAIGQDLIPIQRAWNEMLAKTYTTITENIESSRKYKTALVENARAMGISEEAIQQYLQGSRKLPPELEKIVTDTLLAGEVTAEVDKQMRDLGYTLDATSGKWVKNAKSIEEDTEAMTKANEETIKGVEKFTKLYETGEEKISELYGKRTELENDLQRLRSQGYSDEGENIKEVVGKMGEVDAAIQKTKDEFDKATNQIIFDYSLQMLAADGLTKKEMEGILTWGRNVGLFSDNAITAFNSAMLSAQQLSDTIQAIPDKTINVNVVTRQYSEDYRSRGIEGGLMGGRGYAEGASFTVPPGYPNDSFPMRVESGEHVQVTPKGKSSAGGNTNYNITLNYSPLVSLADRAEAEQKLVPFIESALRKARK